MSCYFAKIFVDLLVIAAVCYFNGYELIGWDLANIQLFKVNSRDTANGVIYVQSYQKTQQKVILVFLLLTLNIHTFFQCFYSIVDFAKSVNVSLFHESSCSYHSSNIQKTQLLRKSEAIFNDVKLGNYVYTRKSSLTNINLFKFETKSKLETHSR